MTARAGWDVGGKCRVYLLGAGILKVAMERNVGK